VASPGLSVGSSNAGLYQPASNTLAASVGGTEVLRATSSGGLTLGAAPNGHAFEVATPAGTGNRVVITGGATGSAAAIAAQGSDANVTLSLAGKGTGAVQASANGGLALRIDASGAAPVNFVGVRAGTSGTAALVYGAGSGTNADLQLGAQGSGLVRAVTAPTADNSTAVATTAWVRGQGYSANAVTSVAGRSGAVTLAVADVSGAEASANKGAANGYAALDASGKVPVAQIPSALLGAVIYQGTWNASTNTPTLSSGSGTKGWAYKVNVAGSTALDGISNWTLGDWAIFNGATWDKIDGNPSEVLSVAGRTGDVTLAVGDVSGAAPLASPSFTGSLRVPNWTTAGRPASPTVGMVGYNTDLNRYDHFTGSGWKHFTRLDGDTMTGALLVNSAGSGNVARVSGAASGSPIIVGVDPSSADPDVGIAVRTRGSGALMLSTPDSAFTLVSATIAAGGTGYAVGDILTLSGGTTGGTFPANATVRVSAVSAGVVSAVTMQVPGSYSALLSNPVSTTGGSGSGCTLTVTWGNNGAARGANAVDLQLGRNATAHVASGQYAALIGGWGNRASGFAGLAAGYGSIASGPVAMALGNFCSALGSYSVSLGNQSYDHNLYGAFVFASGNIAVVGDAQAAKYVLRGRSTGGAAVRLTADGAAAGTANIANIPNNTAWTGTLSVVARDTSTGDAGSWVWSFFAISRKASASTIAAATSGASFTGALAGSSGLASSALTSGVDSTNGGLNLSFTPPNSNTWDVVAVYRTAEVQ
jgi:hypothetical protein